MGRLPLVWALFAFVVGSVSSGRSHLRSRVLLAGRRKQATGAAGIPGWGFSPRGQIAVPTGKGIPNVVGTNLPRLAGSQDSYYAWVSNATLVPADNKFTIMTGKDQDDMTDMERKVLTAQKGLQQLEATQKVEASTVEARFEIERNELMAFKEKEASEQKRIRDNELRIRQMKQEIHDAWSQIQRNERLKRDPALADACSPGFMIYFTSALESALGHDDKKVIAKALKDQYCDLKDLSCLCDMKKRIKGRPLSSLGHVRSHLDCQCATKVKGRYKMPKSINELFTKMGRQDLVENVSEKEKPAGGDGPPADGTTTPLSVPAAPPSAASSN